MSVTKQVEVAVADTDVTEEYGVSLTLTDPITMTTVTVEVTREEAAEYAGQIEARASEAMSAYWEDHAMRPTPIRHGFDSDGPVAS